MAHGAARTIGEAKINGNRKPVRLLGVLALGLVVAVAVALAGLERPVGAQTTGWQPKTPELDTRWTAQVSPANAHPEYPRPQMTRSQWKNLNGVWQFAAATQGQAPPFGQNLSESILVPYPIQSALSGIKRNETRSFYRRTFTVPSDWSGQRVMLNFGAVTWEATVYVNGAQVGNHKGSYDSFSFDITDRLRAGENEIVVSVFDPIEDGEQPLGKQRRSPAPSAFFSASSGIWQTVWLEPVGPAHVTELDMTPDIDTNRLDVTVHAANPAGKTVVVRALDGGAVVGTATGQPGSRISLSVPNAKLWSPDNPFLYDLDVQLREGDRVVDRVGSYFGMREVGLAQINGVTRPTLNGRFVFQMGPLDQGYWPDGLYTAPTDEALKFDVQATKDLGFNMIRKHVKVEPQRWYYHADKLGMLVWQDMPSMAFPKFFISDPAKQQFEAELEQMIDEHENSPSIVSWIPFNEGWGQYDVARITEAVDRRDPSRLSNGNSGAANCCNATEPGNGDLIDEHIYIGPSSPNPTPSRAAVLGEYGCVGVRTPGHEWDSTKITNFQPELVPDGATATRRYVELNSELEQLARKPGLSAAVYTGTTDVEAEYCGLYSYDREVLKVDRTAVRNANLKLIQSSGSASPPPAIPNQQAAAWTFENQGTAAADSSGNNRPLVLRDGATFGPGRTGGGLDLTGNPRHASTDAPVLDTSGSFTVSTWVKLDTLSDIVNVVGQDGREVSGFYLQFIDGRFAFTMLDADATGAKVSRATNNYEDGRSAPTANTWYHLVGVRDVGSDAITLYIDGVAHDSRAYTGRWNATGPTTVGRGLFWFGGRVDYLRGDVDNVRLWNRALSPSEVRALYDVGG